MIFHLSQSFYRKIQKQYFLHKKYKEENSEVGNWLKCCYMLIFLPPTKVGDEFTQLMSTTHDIEHATNFSNYVLHNYVSENANFLLSMWVAEPSNSLRTTNVPE